MSAVESYLEVGSLIDRGAQPVLYGLLTWIIVELQRTRRLILDLRTRQLALEQRVFGSPYPHSGE